MLDDVLPVPEEDPPLPVDVPSDPGAINPAPDDDPPGATDVSISREEGSPVADGTSVLLTEGARGMARVERCA